MAAMAKPHPRPAAARRTDGSPKPKQRRMRAPERRLQLIDVARSVFARSGYFGATMDDVAHAAGITKPILYQHFASKKALYLALIDEAAFEITKAVWDGTEGKPDALSMAAGGMRAYFDYVKYHPDSFRILFSDAQADQEIMERIDSIRSVIAERVAQLISNSIFADWPDEQQIQIVATGIVGLAEMVGRDWIVADKASPEEAARALGTLVASGYVGRNVSAK
ncbi:MAG: hypothetical protein DCC49_00680 [Acidobacteria bacterium]|nr:MAG: hypothetical protein DCC49_00680 [Acidobacteriota bacterium]